ncbi:MAG: anaerobic ribonucleoside-triphosphate reductase activating protein [Oscillospiraceae bacterium]|nr:anaerobic ribonucleoside-triphosphate reductase activating protein [Oscillospiraceae bacterium]
MKLYGLQKMTLLDFPGRVACTVFLGGCDFRCPFCHNSELIDCRIAPLMDSAELLEFLQKRCGLLDGVVISGGEPLLQDVTPLIEAVRALGFAVKLDTNGTHPARLRALMERGLLDYVAMDVKNSPARYAETAGLPTFDMAPVRESIELLCAGDVDYEFRTTVVRELHDRDSFAGIGELICGARRYFLQSFTDRDTVCVEGLHAPERAEMLEYAEIVRPFVGEVTLRGVD